MRTGACGMNRWPWHGEPVSVYRPDKVLLHPDCIQALCRGQQPAPVQAELILSDLCNQDCPWCAFRSEGYSSNVLFAVRDETGKTVDHNPHRMIPFEKVKEILDDCVLMGVQAIQITGGGE